MGVPEDVARFANDLRGRGVSTEITTFPSGAVMLDVRRGDRLFVLAYSPSWPGFGVDEVLGGTGVTPARSSGYARPRHHAPARRVRPARVGRAGDFLESQLAEELSDSIADALNRIVSPGKGPYQDLLFFTEPSRLDLARRE